MSDLTYRFCDLIDDGNERDAVALVDKAPSSPERDGLMGYIYYYGIGDETPSTQKAFAMFERGVKYDDSMSLYMLGLMCDRQQIPGDRHKTYARPQAKHLMERCAGSESLMSLAANLWLGQYYIDMERGADIDRGLDILSHVADDYDCEDAVVALVDYYRSVADNSSLPVGVRTRAAFTGARWSQRLNNHPDTTD